MPGIDLNQFATGASQIKPSEGYSRPDDGTYEYEVTKIGIHKGPKGQSIFIDYRLDNGGTHRDWFGLPAVFGQETQQERDALGRYLRRLIDLGVPAETVNSFSDTDSLVGWRGVLDLVTSTSKGKQYQNARNFRAGAEKAAEPRTDAAFIPADSPAAPAQSNATPTSTSVAGTNPFG